MPTILYGKKRRNDNESTCKLEDWRGTKLLCQISSTHHQRFYSVYLGRPFAVFKTSSVDASQAMAPLRATTSAGCWLKGSNIKIRLNNSLVASVTLYNGQCTTNLEKLDKSSLQRSWTSQENIKILNMYLPRGKIRNIGLYLKDVTLLNYLKGLKRWDGPCQVIFNEQTPALLGIIS